MTTKERCLQRISQNLVTITVLITIIALVINLFGSPSVTRVMAAEGISLGIYWDADCTTAVSAISWGSLTPGTFRDVRVYFKNEGDVALRLHLITTNWDPPEASEHISLTWNYDGRTLNPDQVVEVVLKLSLSSNIEGVSSFSFDILIDCEEVPLAPPEEEPPPPPSPPPPPPPPPPSPPPLRRHHLLVKWM